MKKSLTLTSIVLISLLVLTAGVLCFALGSQNVAYADDPVHFTISTANGSHWELRLETAIVSTADGNFFNFENPNDETSPRNVFEEEILHQLALLSKGAEEYELSFVIPTPVIYFLDGIDSNPYTETDDSMIVVRTDYAELFSTNDVILEYRKVGESDFAVFPTIGASELRFGKNMDKGDYELRINLSEEFKYLGRDYTASAKSEPLVCHITDSKIPDDEIEIPSLPALEYGLTLTEIAERVSAWDRNGIWTVSTGQNADYVLPASDDARVVKMDFQPNNLNYDKNLGLSVPIVVSQRKLEVYVEDVNVIVGADLVSDFVYHVESALAPGDTLESIGFKVTAEGVNKDKVGTYFIRASVSNDNYLVVNRNVYDMHVAGGKYIVHSKGVVVHTQDYRDLTFYREDGFIGYEITVVVLDSSQIEAIGESIATALDEKDAEISSGYLVTIKDADGNEVDLDGVTLTIENKGGEIAVAYLGANGEWITEDLQEGAFELPNGVRAFVVLKQLPAPYYRSADWNAGLTATCVLIILFAAATWIVVVISLTKRRILK